MFRTSRATLNGRMRRFDSTANMPVAISDPTKPSFGAILSGEAINDGTLGCWIFNEGTGTTAYDLSSYENNGFITGNYDSPTWITNDDGKPCLSFESYNESFVQVDGWGLVAPTTEMTFFFRQWANGAAVQATFNCSSGGTDWLGAQVPWSSGSVDWDAGDPFGKRLSYSPGVTITGKWVEWIMIASATGTFSKIYRDGILDAEDDLTPGFVRTNVPLYLGCANGYQNFFGGKIDFLRVWGRALEESEITVLTETPYAGIIPS